MLCTLHLLQTITNLLADDRYPARLVGGSLIHVIFDKWSNSKVSW